MSEIRSYKDLLVWQKGIELVKVVYLITKDFPKDEQFGLTSQIRRSAVSVPSNIAEGYGRDYTRNYSQFLKIARGSLTELETQIIIAKEVEYLNIEDYNKVINIITEENKMLNSLIKKMESFIKN